MTDGGTDRQTDGRYHIARSAYMLSCAKNETANELNQFVENSVLCVLKIHEVPVGLHAYKISMKP